VTIGVDVVIIGVMLGAVQVFYFPRRSRILAKHARRTTHTDLSAFAHQSSIYQALSTIKEPVLWIDVSMTQIWYTFAFCVIVLVAFLPFSISFVAVSYTEAGWIVTTLLPLLAGIAFIFYYTTNRGQFAKINILTQRGAYIIPTNPIQSPIFTPYSAMTNVAVTESYRGLGSVMFAGGGKSAIGFNDIPAPHSAMKILNDQIEALPQFAQSGSRPAVVLLSANESAPLLSGTSSNIF